MARPAATPGRFENGNGHFAYRHGGYLAVVDEVPAETVLTSVPRISQRLRKCNAHPFDPADLRLSASSLVTSQPRRFQGAKLRGAQLPWLAVHD